MYAYIYIYIYVHLSAALSIHRYKYISHLALLLFDQVLLRIVPADGELRVALYIYV